MKRGQKCFIFSFPVKGSTTKMRLEKPFYVYSHGPERLTRNTNAADPVKNRNNEAG